jgi:nifR3 family TIM-barrel protein
MTLHSVKIGNLITENNVFLAPLAGYTNAVFRQMCFDLGASLTFTEMVSAKGLCYNSQNTKELLLVTKEYEGIKAVQLFGSDPEYMQKAAESEEISPFDLIDINMGCPVPKIYNNGEGSALLNNLHLAEKIISACKKSGKNVSVKFRIGVDDKHIVTKEFAKMCEGAGADMITVHGRTRDKIYSGDVNFAEIATAKEAVKIPVIANGGIFSKEDADNLLDKTGADGISLARGAMYNPFLISEICCRKIADKKKMIEWQLDKTFELYDEHFATVYMRKMIAFYIKGMPNSIALKMQLYKAGNKREIEDILSTINFN